MTNLGTVSTRRSIKNRVNVYTLSMDHTGNLLYHITVRQYAHFNKVVAMVPTGNEFDSPLYEIELPVSTIAIEKNYLAKYEVTDKNIDEYIKGVLEKEYYTPDEQSDAINECVCKYKEELNKKYPWITIEDNFLDYSTHYIWEVM